jgi:hypothetical protein
MFLAALWFQLNQYWSECKNKDQPQYFWAQSLYSTLLSALIVLGVPLVCSSVGAASSVTIHQSQLRGYLQWLAPRKTYLHSHKILRHDAGYSGSYLGRNHGQRDQRKEEHPTWLDAILMQQTHGWEGSFIAERNLQMVGTYGGGKMVGTYGAKK